MKDKFIIKRWSPAELNIGDVKDIVLDYGCNNDSLLCVSGDINIIEWEIRIEIVRLDARVSCSYCNMLIPENEYIQHLQENHQADGFNDPN